MNDKIFLRKYRVSAAEIEAMGELGDKYDHPLAYEGVEMESGRKVVVEVVSAASLKPGMRDQVEAEAISMTKLVHVNIPVLHDFGFENDHLIYVTEDFDGTLAEEWVGTYGPMPVGAVLRIASQVVSALGVASLHRIVHRAISPGNLLLMPGQTAEGEGPLIKLLHFVGGPPKLAENGGSAAVPGESSRYASPEQLRGGAIDFQSEIYSLGCTMSFLLTGAPPPMTPKVPMAAPPEKIGPAAGKTTGMPKNVSLLLAQMLSVDPAARPADPLAFYRQLQGCLTQHGGRASTDRAPAVSVFPRTRTLGSLVRRRIPTKALALAALVLAAGVLAVLIVPGYLQHFRVVQAKPIGAPPGVPQARASATPATIVAHSDSKGSVPTASARNPVSSIPARIDFSRMVSASQVEIPTAPAESRAKKKLRRTEPVEAQARRAAPAPPAEGPAGSAPGPNKSATPPATSTLKRTEVKPDPAKPRAKKAEPAKATRKAGETINRPTPSR